MLASLPRRSRAMLSAFLWEWTKPRPPREFAPIDHAIARAAKLHQPRRHLVARKLALRTEALRRDVERMRQC